MIKNIGKIISNPIFRFSVLSSRGFYNWMSDEAYVKREYKLRTGKELNLQNVKTFNEKIQWLKVYDHNPAYPELVDKYRVKSYVEKKIGREYVIPTLGVWKSFLDINLDNLPNQFVLKCTHDSGGVVVVKNKDTFDFLAAKRKLEKSLSRNYYYSGREWGYKNVEPQILAEEYLEDGEHIVPDDYKIFNFSGQPKIIQVDFDRFGYHRRNLYDTHWNYINASIKYPKDPDTVINKPEKLEEMLDLARILSSGFPHVRTDFYMVDNQIYFGELTFWHGSGYEKFEPEELGEIMGEWIKLPEPVNKL